MAVANVKLGRANERFNWDSFVQRVVINTNFMLDDVVLVCCCDWVLVNASIQPSGAAHGAVIPDVLGVVVHRIFVNYI